MKKNSKKCYLLKKGNLLLLFIFLFPYASAQVSRIANSNPIPDRVFNDEIFVYEELELPPLDVLFENAKNVASLKYLKTLKEQERSALTSINRDWTKYVRIDGSYRYGKNSFQSSSDNSVVTEKQDKFQSWYSAGISLSIPIEDIIDRGQRKKRQKLRIQAVDDQMESTYIEVKVAIIELYTQAQKELEIMKMRIEELTFSEARYKDVEANFLSGRITTQELGDQKSLLITSTQNYLESKYMLSSVLLKLELLTNTQIFNDAQTRQTLRK